MLKLILLIGVFSAVSVGNSFSLAQQPALDWWQKPFHVHPGKLTFDIKFNDSILLRIWDDQGKVKYQRSLNVKWGGVTAKVPISYWNSTKVSSLQHCHYMYVQDLSKVSDMRLWTEADGLITESREQIPGCTVRTDLNILGED